MQIHLLFVLFLFGFPTIKGCNDNDLSLRVSGYCNLTNTRYGHFTCSCRPDSLPEIKQITLNGTCSIPTETLNLTIIDCSKVTIGKNALSYLKYLNFINLHRIKELGIESQSFRWIANSTYDSKEIQIVISDTAIADIPPEAFYGNIKKITIKNSYIGNTQKFSFTNLNNTEIIRFKNCTIANVEQQTFKKLSVSEFKFHDTTFNFIHGRFVVDVHVIKEFAIVGCLINIVDTLAFEIKHSELIRLSNNRISVTRSEAFKIESRGKVIISENIFENIEDKAFLGIHLDYFHLIEGKKELIFQNNTLPSTITKDTLAFNETSFIVRVTQIRIPDSCTCDKLTTWSQTISHKQDTDVESIKELYCPLESKNEGNFDFVSGYGFYMQYCWNLESGVYFFVIMVVSTAVLLCIVIIIVIVCLKRNRTWLVVPSTDVKEAALQKLNPHLVMPAKGVVVPDGRTYRETEFHVVEEKVIPMDNDDDIPCRLTKEYSKFNK